MQTRPDHQVTLVLDSSPGHDSLLRTLAEWQAQSERPALILWNAESDPAQAKVLRDRFLAAGADVFQAPDGTAGAGRFQAAGLLARTPYVLLLDGRHVMLHGLVSHLLSHARPDALVGFSGFRRSSSSSVHVDFTPVSEGEVDYLSPAAILAPRSLFRDSSWASAFPKQPPLLDGQWLGDHARLRHGMKLIACGGWERHVVRRDDSGTSGTGKFFSQRATRSARARPDRIAAVCCHFNPCGYRKRVENYLRFRRGAAGAGIKILTVELGHDNRWDVPDHADLIRVRRGDVMWQKERLLSIGAARLVDAGYDKIIWMDADVIFPDDHWARRIDKALDRTRVAQGCSDLLVEYADGFRVARAAVRSHHETGQYSGPSPGGIWGAHAELFSQVGLYQHCILGGGDSAFEIATHRRRAGREAWLAQAARYPILRVSQKMAAHYLAWTDKLAAWLDGNVGWAEQSISVQEHGARTARRYRERHDLLSEFDPAIDVRATTRGGWEWSSERPALHQNVRDYFTGRAEDG